MAQLYFYYSAMNAGKSTMLLQAAYNYLERGMLVYLLTAKLDQRAGDAKIASRIGLSMDAQTFEAETNIYDQLSEAYSKDGDDKAPFACVFVDEAQCARGPQSLRSLDRC
jgi:thymidine kinase